MNGRLRKEVRAKSVQRFREAIRARTPRLKNRRRPRRRRITLARLRQNPQVGEMIESLNQYLEGRHWYFKRVWSCDWYTPTFDQFVRRRVRTAVTGRTGKGWWLVQLSNAAPAELGLISVAHLNRVLPVRPVERFCSEEPNWWRAAWGKPHVRFGKAGGRATAP